MNFKTTRALPSEGSGWLKDGGVDAGVDGGELKGDENPSAGRAAVVEVEVCISSLELVGDKAVFDVEASGIFSVGALRLLEARVVGILEVVTIFSVRML